MTVKITITFGPPPHDPKDVEHYVGTHAPLVRALPGFHTYEYGRALTNFDGSEPTDAFWVVALTFDSEGRDARHVRESRWTEDDR